MSAKVATVETADRCELCGYRSDGGFRDRMAHLRSAHPAYARGLLLRLAAPPVFLVLVVALAAVKAPSWLYIVALFVSFGLLFFGKQKSRLARTKAGTTATMPLKRLVREGGLGFILIFPAIVLLILIISRS